jgi:exopolysaccharide biosynthesis polyprenyl glycosylphosphotransferase
VAAGLVAADLIAVSIAVITACVARFGFPDVAVPVADLLFACALPLVWVAASAGNRGYDVRFVGSGGTEFRRLARTFTHVLAATAVISYAADLQIARGFIVAALPLSLLLTATGRYLARLRLQRLRRAGREMDRVLVVGRAGSLQPLITAMRREPAAGLLVVGACLPSDEAEDPAVRRAFADLGVPVVADLEHVPSAADRCAAARVAVVAGDVGTQALRAISWGLEESGAELIVSSGLSEMAGQRVRVQSVSGTPLLRVDPPRYRGLRHLCKAGFDRAVAAIALALLSPMLIVLGVIVRCTSRGPAFYLQKRIGRNGVPFRMVKFRSMYRDADHRLPDLLAQNDAADGLLFKMRDDPRVTPVGRWLRRFSLDELPQLINVLTGAMSLVGPRPPLPSEVALYEGEVGRRLLVKPGLTGLWQVSGRSDLSWEESVRLDLHYVENWTLGLDLQLLLRTARVVVKATGAY